MSLAETTQSNASPAPRADLVGVFKTLAQQHQEARELLEQVRGNPALRAQLWPVIRTELVSHERGEVKEVIPVLRAHPGTRGFANHHDHEAVELETLIAQLDALPIASDVWGETFSQLADTVIDHATREEELMFPEAQRELGEARALQLDAPFLKAKQQVAESV